MYFLVLNLNMPSEFVLIDSFSCNGHTQFLKHTHKLFKMPVSVALSKQLIFISYLFSERINMIILLNTYQLA
jgi:hypothetical protein